MARGLSPRFTPLLAMLFLSLLLVGCSAKKDDDKKDGDKKDGDKKTATKVTKENAAKLKDGMPEKEVLDILGEPTEKKDLENKEKEYTWKNGSDMIQIVVKDGKMAYKKQEMFVNITIK